MDPQHSQYRDITVGALLTRLAETLPGHEALVYSERGLRLTWNFPDSVNFSERFCRDSSGAAPVARLISFDD
jgi:hypothetical protein